MPIEDGLLIGMKDGVVELTATLARPQQDGAEDFAAALGERLFEHQYQVMTDATILDPEDLRVASCLICRDPIPDPLRDGLLSLGFQPVESDGGGREERSLFARFGRSRRSKLDKWRLVYSRARDISPKLSALEDCLVDEVPSGELPEVAEAASRVLIDAARTCLRLLLTPSSASLGELERALLAERGAGRGRLVLHPAMVRALAAFTGEALRRESREAHWSDDPDDDAPLHIVTEDGSDLGTDPEFRVVKFVARGRKEMLSTYVEDVLMQAGGESR